jgi:hypothetical protein
MFIIVELSVKKKIGPLIKSIAAKLQKLNIRLLSRNKKILMALMNLSKSNLLELEIFPVYIVEFPKKMARFMLSNKLKKLNCNEYVKKLIFLWKNTVFLN